MAEVADPANRDHQQHQVEPAAGQQTVQRLGVSLAWNPACRGGKKDQS